MNSSWIELEKASSPRLGQTQKILPKRQFLLSMPQEVEASNQSVRWSGDSEGGNSTAGKRGIPAAALIVATQKASSFHRARSEESILSISTKSLTEGCESGDEPRPATWLVDRCGDESAHQLSELYRRVASQQDDGGRLRRIPLRSFDTQLGCAAVEVKVAT